MKKTICIYFAALAFLLVNSFPVMAGYGGHGGHGGYGGRGYGGHRGYGGYGGRSGIGIWLGPGWSGVADYSYYPYYPVYQEPPAIAPQQPDIYVQSTPQPEQSSYWYYCQNPKGYYPYVKKCQSGWMKVVPTPPPTDQEE
jgi:hypothetical protein